LSATKRPYSFGAAIAPTCCSFLGVGDRRFDLPYRFFDGLGIANSSEENSFMAYVITEGCTKDEKCVEVCPVDCIHPRSDEPKFAEISQLYIDPGNCIDCGACVPVCEVSAIYAEGEVPEHLAAFTGQNAQYYQ
jgi:NAD-dependent dihydropyrimidine dehydrogenase PreA subunit